MAARTDFDPEKGIWTIRLSGIVTAEDVIEASRAIDESPEPQRNAPRLWDARDTAPQQLIQTEDLRALATGPDAIKAKGRVAILVRRDVDFGVARMYQAYANEWAAELRVFRDPDDALRWLGGSD